MVERERVGSRWIARFGWVLILGVVVLATIVYIVVQRSHGSGQSSSGNPIVAVTSVRVQTVTEHLFEQGTVTTPDQAAVMMPVGTTVSPTLMVSVGQLVNAGQVVATTPDAAEAAQYSAAQAAAAAEYSAWQDARKQVQTAQGQGVAHTSALYLQLQQAEASAYVQYLNARASVIQAQAGESASAIVAPISGTVIAVTPPYSGASQGGAPMIQIADLKDLQVTANLSQGDATAISAGDAVAITSDSFAGESWRGKVLSISPVALASLAGGPATVPVVVSVPKHFSVPLGFGVNLKVSADQVRGLAIPYSALVENGVGTQVWIVQHGVVNLVSITLGVTGDTEASVVAGLKAGESVVVNPSPNLYEGEDVSLS